jgi:hypothetical protein
MTQEEKQLYGYAIIEIKTVGHGEIWWDEYYETNEYKIVRTKLFSSEEERDMNENEDRTKYHKEIYDESLVILPFETEMP